MQHTNSFYCHLPCIIPTHVCSTICTYFISSNKKQHSNTKLNKTQKLRFKYHLNLVDNNLKFFTTLDIFYNGTGQMKKHAIRSTMTTRKQNKNHCGASASINSRWQQIKLVKCGFNIALLIKMVEQIYMLKSQRRWMGSKKVDLRPEPTHQILFLSNSGNF